MLTPCENMVDAARIHARGKWSVGRSNSAHIVVETPWITKQVTCLLRVLRTRSRWALQTPRSTVLCSTGMEASRHRAKL